MQESKQKHGKYLSKKNQKGEKKNKISDMKGGGLTRTSAEGGGPEGPFPLKRIRERKRGSGTRPARTVGREKKLCPNSIEGLRSPSWSENERAGVVFKEG